MDQLETTMTTAIEKRSNRWIYLRIFLILLGLFAIYIGLPIENGLRHWVFEETKPIRFREDAERGFAWGKECLRIGYFNLYDDFARRSQDPSVWLDYAPLRLGVMSFWAKYNSYRFPDVNLYQNTFEFARPVLWFNCVIELVGIAGMFLLVRHWVRRQNPDLAKQNPNLGWVRAFIAAMLLWFSPAATISAYGWPTWDVWVPTFFIWAIYLACIDLWFLAGVVIGIGAMFKGQQLAVATLFIIWPIASGAPKRMFYAAISAITFLLLGVLFQYPLIGIISAIGLILSIGLIAYDAIRHGDWIRVLRWISGLVCAISIVVFGWMIRTPEGNTNWLSIGWILCCLAGAVTVWLFFPRSRRFKYLYALSLGFIVLLCVPFFGASSNWFEYGWRFGTTHFNQLIVGLPNNIPALLTKRFGYYNTETESIVFSITKGHWLGSPGAQINITLRMLMKSIFILLMIPCAISAAGLIKRNDPRFLVAICTPWLLFYMLPLQIHERYLLYFAMASTCFIALSNGMLLISLLTTIFSFAVTLNILLNPTRREQNAFEKPDSIFIQYGNELREYCNSLHPDSAWALVLVTLICLYYSYTSSRSIAAMKSPDVKLSDQSDRTIILDYATPHTR